jgi:hypothetical protein
MHLLYDHLDEVVKVVEEVEDANGGEISQGRDKKGG